MFVECDGFFLLFPKKVVAGVQSGGGDTNILLNVEARNFHNPYRKFMPKMHLIIILFTGKR